VEVNDEHGRLPGSTRKGPDRKRGHRVDITLPEVHPGLTDRKGPTILEADHSTAAGDEGGTDPLEHLAASARGWHGIQLAVLGFIGFCGLLWDGGGADRPAAVQWVALALVLTGFVLALVAILLVGRVAYPFHGPTGADEASGTVLPRATRRLHTGIGLTYLAVGLVVAATLSAWWPDGVEGAAAEEAARDAVVADVAVVADTGQAWCGQLVATAPGEIGLMTATGPVRFPLDRVASLGPGSDC